MKEIIRKCLECNEVIVGRVDKKFCSEYCKSSYHYKQNRSKQDSVFIRVDKILKNNRRILKSYNKVGKSTVRKNILIEDGFNPKYFTNYWKAKNNNLYLFCYEYGFMEIKEKGYSKYVLIIWQEYMS